MNKAQQKFRLYAILVMFALTTALLAVINGMNFTMAASDADEITQRLADRYGVIDRAGSLPGDGQQGDAPPEEWQPGERQQRPGRGDFRFGPMGPESPEMDASLRYFTFSFDKDGAARTVVFNMSAVTEDEAREWARGLLSGDTGWTRGIYRYRVFNVRDTTCVTVIDQGRELLPSFRILIISAAGEALFLVIGYILLIFIGKKVYAPIEEADRKQKGFIKNANREFRLPLTIIEGNVELSERRYGPDDQTRSTRRQIGKLNELIDRLGSVGLFDEGDASKSDVPLSEYFEATLDREKEKFASRGIEVESRIEPGVSVSADPDAMNGMIGEIVENACRYAKTHASFTLARENGYVLIETANDTDLPDGQVNQAFDRFTKLENASADAAGLGLSLVKETVKAHSGRASASVEGGEFRLRITL